MMKTQNVVENVNRVKIFKNNRLLIRDGLYKTYILDLGLGIAPLFLMTQIVNSTNQPTHNYNNSKISSSILKINNSTKIQTDTSKTIY